MDDILKQIPEDLLFALLDNPYESLILVDAEGIVRFVSSSNEGNYRLPIKEALGRHISELSPESKLTKVLETGKAQMGRSMRIKDKQRVVARFPLVKDGKVIGTAGKLMVSSPAKLRQLYEQIETLEKNLDYYKEQLGQAYGIRYSFESIVGESAAIKKAKESARRAAATASAVIISGESGTGKELLAHSIHQAGKRQQYNFVRVNCAAIPAELIEAELFGYAPGAYTGARSQGKPGKFELAHKGTIFLDEIGDMPPAMQVKLMRVLQEKEVERVGGNEPRPLDFRLISATHRDLEKMMAKGTFRLDLYYRLNVMTIQMPALRDIPEDIPLIFDHFIEKLSAEHRRNIRAVSPQAIDALKRYHWPGNVRELRNVAERALIVCGGKRIEATDLPMALRNRTPKTTEAAEIEGPLKSVLAAAERRAIVQALKKNGNNRAQAARSLGIHRTGLYQKMKKYGLA